MSKHSNKSNRVKRIIIMILGIVLVCSIIAIVVTKLKEYRENKSQMETSQVLEIIDVSQDQITEEVTERMLQVQELKNQNADVIGWIEIADTNISYPVLQGQDNDYYLTHNYKKEKISSGSLFLDKSYDFDLPSSNLLIYGHRNKKGLMFEDLLKYKDESFYKEHKNIRFTTTAEDKEYEILAVFYSRVYYKNETDVFRYYYFVNAENEQEYNEYVSNSKKASIYDTGVNAEYGEQLLTLSTCEYSQNNGRFVIVAKKVK